MGLDTQDGRGRPEGMDQSRAEIRSESLISQEISDAISVLQEQWFADSESVADNAVFARIAEYLLPDGHPKKPEGVDGFFPKDEADNSQQILDAVHTIMNNDNLIRKILRLVMLKASNSDQVYTYPEIDTLLEKFTQGKEAAYTLSRVIKVMNDEAINMTTLDDADPAKQAYKAARDEARARIAERTGIKGAAVVERDIDIALAQAQSIGTKYVSAHVDKTKKPTYMWARDPLAFGTVRDSLNGVLDTMMGQLSVNQGYIDLAPADPRAQENNKNGGILGTLVLSGDLTPQQAYYLRKAIFDKMRIGRQETFDTIRPAVKNRMITSLWILDTYGFGDLQKNERSANGIYTPRLAFTFPNDLAKLTQAMKLHAHRFFALDGSVADKREEKTGIKSAISVEDVGESGGILSGFFKGKEVNLLTALEELDMGLPVDDMRANNTAAGVRNLPGASLSPGGQMHIATASNAYKNDLEGIGNITIGKLVFAAGRAEELRAEYLTMRDRLGDNFWRLFRKPTALTAGGNERNPEESLEVYMEVASGLDKALKSEIRDHLKLVRGDITNMVAVSNLSKKRIKGFLPNSRDKKNNVPLVKQIEEIRQFVTRVDALRGLITKHHLDLGQRIKELESGGNLELVSLIKEMRAYYGYLLSKQQSALNMSSKTAKIAKQSIPGKEHKIRQRRKRIEKSRAKKKAMPPVEVQKARSAEVQTKYEVLQDTLSAQHNEVKAILEDFLPSSETGLRALLAEKMPDMLPEEAEQYIVSNLDVYNKKIHPELARVEASIGNALSNLKEVDTATASELQIMLTKYEQIVAATRTLLAKLNNK